MYAPCPACDGEGSVPCESCSGTGEEEYEDTDIGEWVTRDCQECDGTGFMPCGTCGGSTGYDTASELGFDDAESWEDNML
jgi:DnaJ-class molecular chaperone